MSMILDADYAAVEARIVVWLAGQEDAMEQFRAYDRATTSEERYELDPYRLLASDIYGIPVERVNKHPQRMVGKHARLGCGFGMGADKFRATVKKLGGYDLPAGMEQRAIKTYRDKNKMVVKYWYDTERTAKKAILSPGEVFSCRMAKYVVLETGGIPFLLCRLPSGRKLSYPRPEIRDDRISFYGNIKGEVWGRIETWGGTLVQGQTQATAADIMCNGAQNAEDAQYEICALIHDQALAYHREWQTPEEFVKLLTDLPDWADGLPLAAEGDLTPFYRKG